MKSVRAVFEAADTAGIGWDDVVKLCDEGVYGPRSGRTSCGTP